MPSDNPESNNVASDPSIGTGDAAATSPNNIEVKGTVEASKPGPSAATAGPSLTQSAAAIPTATSQDKDEDDEVSIE